jgi:AcrR family transcriptional regulator
MKQDERRSEAERRLIAAAAELIGEGGPSRVTLALVGERAGYSRGLATHHFGSKGALIERVVQAVTEEFRAELEGERTPDSSWQQLLALVRLYVKVIADLPPTHRARLVLMADAVTPSSEVRPAIVASDRLFRKELARGIERGAKAGEFSSAVDATALALVVVGMLRGLAFQAMIDERLDLERARREIELLLRTRLQPRARKKT